MPIQSGQPIEILAPVGSLVLTWDSEILEVDDTSFEIRRPERRRVKLPAKSDGALQVVIASRRGLCSMTCRILGGDSQRVRLALPGPDETQIAQRRRHVRVPLRPPQDVTLCLDPEWNFEPVSGEMVDISEAGCRIRVGASLMEGMPVQIEMRGLAPDHGLVAGKVVYNSPLPGSNLIGVHFEQKDAFVARFLESVRAC